MLGLFSVWNYYESDVVNVLVFLYIGIHLGVELLVNGLWKVLALKYIMKHFKEFIMLRYPSHLYALHFSFFI